MEKNNKKILIIEDDLILLGILVKKFKLEGFEILKAKNGQSGLELALKEHPELILLDIILPKMDGVTVLRELRADKWGKSASIIILTNLSEVGSAEDIKEDVSAYLVKSSWEISEVVRKVKEKLGLE